MDHDFYEWASDAHLRAPDGFSEMATAAGVSASVAERNEMLAYALRTFSRGHAQLLARILSGYERARKLQVRGMAAYAAVAVLALVVVLALPLPMEADLRVIAWLSFAGLLFAAGRIEDGLKVVKAVRDKYDGRKRNPWNEIECGSNYARSMASFAFRGPKPRWPSHLSITPKETTRVATTLGSISPLSRYDTTRGKRLTPWV